MHLSCKLTQKLIRLPRPAKATVVLLLDLCTLPVALCVALSLKLGQLVYPSVALLPLLIVAALSGVAPLASLGFYSAVSRFVARTPLLRICIVAMFSAVALEASNVYFMDPRASTSTFVIYAFLLLLHVGGSRLAMRVLLSSKEFSREPVAIYGASAAGARLATTLRDSSSYEPVAFMDYSTELHGRTVAGLPVYPPTSMPDLISKFHVQHVLLAIPTHPRSRRQSVVRALEREGVHVQTVPDIADIVSGRAAVTDLREVDACDLLGRAQVAPDEQLLHACVRGKVVLVSGAGGSIGSELCRQIVRLRPMRLVLLELSEPALYQVDREIQSIASSERVAVEVIGLLGNAHHRHRMREILKTYKIQTVYHAAAYKHVPIVEQNIIEGIHNNVFSTYYIAEAALECRVETFVLVSSDKAVNPTNVMGSTKRFAELTLQGMQQRSTHTRFCIVRFGNVLESSGSVVPLFREQIKRGGPVTVTHKDIIRYFMTIPEAAQLVIQAGSMAQGGDVFVLDMSEPVRIDELARRMIRLTGLTVRDADTPQGDIEIIYTGLRPAEKLYEELLIGDNVSRTVHPRIMRAMEHSLPWVRMQSLLDDLLTALHGFDCERAHSLLREAVTEYRPQGGIQDLVWMHAQPSTANWPQVTDIRTHRLRGNRADSAPVVGSLH